MTFPLYDFDEKEVQLQKLLPCRCGKARYICTRQFGHPLQAGECTTVKQWEGVCLRLYGCFSFCS